MPKFLKKHWRTLLFTALMLIFAIVFLSLNAALPTGGMKGMLTACVIVTIIILWCLYAAFDIYLFSEELKGRFARKFLLFLGIFIALVMSLVNMGVTMSYLEVYASSNFIELSVWRQGLLLCWPPCFMLLLYIMTRTARSRVWLSLSEKNAGKYNTYTAMYPIVPYIVIIFSYFIGVLIAVIGIKAGEFDKWLQNLTPFVVVVLLAIMFFWYIHDWGLPYMKRKGKKGDVWSDGARAQNQTNNNNIDSADKQKEEKDKREDEGVLGGGLFYKNELERALHKWCENDNYVLPNREVKWEKSPYILLWGSTITVSGTIVYRPEYVHEVTDYTMMVLNREASDFKKEVEKNVESAIEKAIEEVKAKYKNYDDEYSYKVTIYDCKINI